MVGLLTVTGGASLAGAWVYKRFEDRKQRRRDQAAKPTTKLPWWHGPWHSVSQRVRPFSHAVAPANPPTPAPMPVAKLPFAPPRHSQDYQIHTSYGLRTSTLALGMTTAGWLFSPPLPVIGLPLLIYMGIPAAQQAYDQLWDEGHPSSALAETVVLAVCLAGGYYWVGALGFWLYYGSRSLLTEYQSANVRRLEEVASITTYLGKDGVARGVPTASLQPGDQVLLHSGDLTGVNGLIVEGVAWVRPQVVSSAKCDLRKTVGDRVVATDIVLIGQICVRVLPSA